MKSSRAGMNGRKESLQKQLVALPSSNPADSKVAELKSAIAALETQMATINQSIASTEATKSQFVGSKA